MILPCLCHQRFSLVQKCGSPCTALAFCLRKKSEFLIGMSDYSLKCFDTGMLYKMLITAYFLLSLFLFKNTNVQFECKTSKKCCSIFKGQYGCTFYFKVIQFDQYLSQVDLLVLVLLSFYFAFKSSFHWIYLICLNWS